MDGSYAAEAEGIRHDGDLHAHRRCQHADDRHVQAQGREDDHRRRAEGPEEAGRGLTAPTTGPLIRRSGSRAVLPPSISIGVDIGGTKVAAGVVDERGTILERLTEPTPSHSPKAVENAILRVVAELRSRHRVEAVGIGAAGWVDNEQAVVRFSPHLAWRSEPLKLSSASGSTCR